MNATFLVNILTQSYPRSTVIDAAVAYADFYEPFVDHIRRHPTIKLNFYGRTDQSQPVSLRLLAWFLNEAPPTAECFLVNGAYHPKVIWWHGYGAYIGSANLTRNGWEKNIEAGVFLDERELAEFGVEAQLERMFDEIDAVSIKLSPDLYQKLEALEGDRRRLQPGLIALQQRYEQLLSGEKHFPGQTTVVRKGELPSRARQTFVDEWRATLGLMRKLCRAFQATGKRPAWVPATANATVHFDQFLHGYYYHYIEATSSGGKAADRVEEVHEKNRSDPGRALGDALGWWTSLTGPPTTNSYNEEIFISEWAPRMQSLLAKDALSQMNVEEFIEVMSHSHAFREHARHYDRKEGLPGDAPEPEDQKLRRICEYIWPQRSRDGHSVVELLQFLIYGSDPAEAEFRLWSALRDDKWRLPHLGKSTLGELIGWARPDDYPPRNNRNNLALRALGYDVETFA